MTPVLEVEDLTVRYGRAADPAVRDVSLQLGPGEILGVVGESGSGKTTLGLAALGLLPPSARAEGSVTFEGRKLLELPPSQLRRLRGDAIATIMQNPSTALNPCYTMKRGSLPDTSTGIEEAGRAAGCRMAWQGGDSRS